MQVANIFNEYAEIENKKESLDNMSWDSLRMDFPFEGGREETFRTLAPKEAYFWLRAAWAAARRAIGTRKGEQLT